MQISACRVSKEGTGKVWNTAQSTELANWAGTWANVKTDYREEKQNILRHKWKDWSQSRVTRLPLGFYRSKLDLITVPQTELFAFFPILRSLLGLHQRRPEYQQLLLLRD